jgi:gamma-polyglutamate biosynthesis protein CapC
VLTPLLKIIRHSGLSQVDDAVDIDDLQAIAQAADIIGYQLFKYRDRLSQQDYFILAEQDDKPAKYWGLYVFRIGATNPYGVQIPRPLYEINSFEYGASLFERLNAQVLMIGTTHPDANTDGSADLINPNNKLSVFNLVNQVLMRESHDESLMLINIRAFSYRADRPFPDADVVFSLADGFVTRQQMNRLSLDLVNKLESDGMTVQLIDGSEQTSGYEVGSTAQAFYLEAASNKTFAVLWLSPSMRASYRQQSENQLQAAQFNSLNIGSLEQDLGTYLQQQRAFSSNTPLDNGFRTLLTQYINEQDVLRLQQVVEAAKDNGYLLTRVLDRNSKQAFFLIKDRSGIPFALVNLTARSENANFVDDKLPFLGQVAEFINQRKMWLLRRPD